MLANDMFPPGPPTECPICQHRVEVEPTSAGDAVCPRCGVLLWPPERAARQKIPDLDGYRLVARISPDQFRAVSPNRTVVAVQLLPRELCRYEMWIRRWQRETELRRDLRHPNIIEVLDSGVFRGRHYMATEYIPGQTANKLLETDGTLKVPLAIEIVKGCCRALEYLHQRDIVHRSVQPDCIHVDRSQVARLTNFGLAATINEALTMTYSGIGYGIALCMSPEQAQGSQSVDHRTDIFSLGATFYYLLTGHLPFEGDTALELMMARVKGETTSVQQRRPDISDSVAHLIHQMLATSPDERPSCQQVVAELTD